MAARPTIFTPDAKFGLRVRVSREVNYAFENERKQLRLDMADRRKTHREDYWRLQTQIENKYFEDLRSEFKQKQRADMDRWRSKICTISKNTKDKITFLEEKERKTLEAMRMQDIRNMRKSIGDKLMLQGFEMEARKGWPTLSNLSEKIEADVVIPQTILNYTEYSLKLQRIAMFAEIGDLEAMQAVLDNQLVYEKKNQMLQPIFRDIKSQIRHMSFTPEYELIKEYLMKRDQIENSVKGKASEEWKTEAMSQLKELYAMLLAKRQQKIRSSLSLRLKTLQNRLNNIFELINLWNQYIEIIYMPESEVHMIDKLSQQEGRTEELSHASRQEKVDIQKRLKMLFKPEDYDKQEATAEATREAYMTVSEAETTDTTSGLDDESLMARSQEDRRAPVKQGNAASAKPKRAVEEGIKSSDEEEDNAAAAATTTEAAKDETTKTTAASQAYSTVGQRKLVDFSGDAAEVGQQDDITSFAAEKAEIFEDEVEREHKEHTYGFSGQSIEEYSAALENRLDQLASIGDKKESAASSQLADEETYETDFIGSTNIKDEISDLDSKVGDLQSLNLFGVEMTADSLINKQSKGSSKADIQAILKDLVQIVTELDPSGTSRDFSKRKSFAYYDPYNPDKSSSFAHLKYEDGTKLRASLIVQQHMESLKDLEMQMESENATVADVQRFESISDMMARLNEIKLTDPQVLLRLYNMYRYQLSEENNINV